MGRGRLTDICYFSISPATKVIPSKHHTFNLAQCYFHNFILKIILKTFLDNNDKEIILKLRFIIKRNYILLYEYNTP